MNTIIDKRNSLKIAGRSFTIKDREDAKPIRDEFLNKYKSLLEDLGSAYGLIEYNAIDKSYSYFLGFELSDLAIIEENGFRTYELGEDVYLEVPVEDANLKEAYRYTYKDFFPNKKYFHGLGPDIEFYQYDLENDQLGNFKLFILLKENLHAKTLKDDQLWKS